MALRRGGEDDARAGRGGEEKETKQVDEFGRDVLPDDDSGGSGPGGDGGSGPGGDDGDDNTDHGIPTDAR